ncbi:MULTISPECIES: ABC transporter substrate-binding protein [Actinomadura]|uniref:Iron(III) transport system substrate-binding protein n=1 Tax=Actinomadura madurae TaxID=1993 RepID=A0A1I5I129_9ACTN|nr:extracellular solute-binding protein [Actinomadura madurae]SFO54069.1 iron(III) transport system substrate-binding protein [Actinomadura madurae]
MKIRIAAAATAAAGVLALTGCGGSGDGSASPTSTPLADVGTASPVTPPAADVLAAAEKEGSVLLYTDADDQIMDPIRKAFEKKYPKIKVKVLSLNSDQIFQRYQTENATRTRTADVVMPMNLAAMQEFAKRGDFVDYEDPNLPNLPDYAKLAPGITAVSLDPVIAVYNKALLPKDKQPKTLADLAKLSATMKGKIGTVDIGNPVGLEATQAYVAKGGDASWATLEELGKNTTIESNVGPLVQKVLQGQYAASYFVSGAVRALITPDAAKVLDWTYLSDATPVLPRTIAVTKAGQSPAAGKVFVNYILSVEGQEAACRGGFSPYRDGVKCAFGVPSIKKVTGTEDLDIMNFEKAAGGRAAIEPRWKAAYGR